MSRARNWCKYVIDDDAWVNDNPHQTVVCGKPIEPGFEFCVAHAAVSPLSDAPKEHQ